MGLAGLVSDGIGPPMLLVDLCEHGSLSQVLQMLPDPRDGSDPAASERLRAGLHIARGMAYLGRMSTVHRDLAARNVLVGAAGTQGGCDGGPRVHRVADFGLSRKMTRKRMPSATRDEDDEYYTSSAGVFAMRWTPLEAMMELKFTVASDVYSFGATMIEVYQAGDLPWIGHTATDVLKLMQSGALMPQPVGCPLNVFSQLAKCLSAAADTRPSFDELVKFFAQELRSPSDPDSRHMAMPFAEAGGDPVDNCFGYEYAADLLMKPSTDGGYVVPNKGVGARRSDFVKGATISPGKIPGESTDSQRSMFSGADAGKAAHAVPISSLQIGSRSVESSTDEVPKPQSTKGSVNWPPEHDSREIQAQNSSIHRDESTATAWLSQKAAKDSGGARCKDCKAKVEWCACAVRKPFVASGIRDLTPGETRL